MIINEKRICLNCKGCIPLNKKLGTFYCSQSCETKHKNMCKYNLRKKAIAKGVINTILHEIELEQERLKTPKEYKIDSMSFKHHILKHEIKKLKY